MRSIKTTVTAAAVLTAGFVLAAPAAHAATVKQDDDLSGCPAAIHAAQQAKHDLKAAIEDLKEEIARGGHPSAAEEQNLRDLKSAAEDAIETAVEECKDMDHHRHHPHGAMHTGVGSTSQGIADGEVAGGLGLLGAAGAGALVLRRRRAGSEG